MVGAFRILVDQVENADAAVAVAVVVETYLIMRKIRMMFEYFEQNCFYSDYFYFLKQKKKLFFSEEIAEKINFGYLIIQTE